MQAFDTLKAFMAKQAPREKCLDATLSVCAVDEDSEVTQPPHDPFYIGQRVAYQIPIHISTPTDYSWEHHTGIVKDVDARNERLTMIPETEAQPWRIVAWVYCTPRGGHEEKASCPQDVSAV